MTPQPSQQLASHLVAQTHSSVALLESLHLITAADAAAIRQHLPNAEATFPQLATASTNIPAAPVASPTYGAPAPAPSYGAPGVTGAMAGLSVGAPVGGAAYQPPAPGGLAPAAPAPALPVRHETHARALWDYNGTEADDLHFRQGDVIIIDEEVNEQWYRGRVIPGGNGVPLEKGGLFPSNYVEKIPQGAPGARTGAGGPMSPTPGGAPAYQPPASPYYTAPTGAYNYTPPNQQQQYGQPQQPQQTPTTVVVQGEDQGKGKMGKLGGRLGNAAVTGAGFGFGSAIAGNIVNAIL